MALLQRDPISLPDQLRWEFIKENKKVRKQELDQESCQENKNSTKKEFLFYCFLVFFYKLPPMVIIGGSLTDSCLRLGQTNWVNAVGPLVA